MTSSTAATATSEVETCLRAERIGLQRTANQRDSVGLLQPVSQEGLPGSTQASAMHRLQCLRLRGEPAKVDSTLRPDGVHLQFGPAPRQWSPLERPHCLRHSGAEMLARTWGSAGGGRGVIARQESAGSRQAAGRAGRCLTRSVALIGPALERKTGCPGPRSPRP